MHSNLTKKNTTALVKCMIVAIQGYRFFMSPWLGRNCRFYPSCSIYAQDSIQLHGALKGIYLSIRRIFKCHPFHPGGYDPVQDKILK